MTKKENLPAEYLAPTPAPAARLQACVWPLTGEPVYCEEQLLDMRDDALDALDMCNADKAAGRAWVAVGGILH